MESLLHTMYVVAIKDTHAWDGDSPADLSMIGFWNLVVVWLKVSDGDVVALQLFATSGGQQCGLFADDKAPHPLAFLSPLGDTR